ncbi:MAG TPA: trigger factor [Acidimicrobiales bacterium]|nr:trigger factor [Acidimicrobiales bacterium]
MRATAAPEEGNKVRLTVEVDESEIDEALNGVLRRLSREVRVPGFRPGKVPRRVIEARLGGASALRDEALREALPEFYAKAVSDTEVDPIDSPEIDITAGDESGAVSFDAIVEVRPTVSIAGYQGLVVTLPGLDVPEEEINAQIDRLRATSGELVDVDRPVEKGDQVTIDITGKRVRGADQDADADAEGEDDGEAGDGEAGTTPPVIEEEGDDDDLTAEDFLYEAGSGGVVPELDDALIGAKAGDTVTFESSIDDLGQTVSFTVVVKDVKELVLPEATDEWAAEASEFETADELRGDITKRLKQRHIMQAQLALQQKTIEALVELVTEDVPDILVEGELRERIHDLNHRLEEQKIGLGQFLAATGRDEQEFLDELRAGALQGVKSDLALRALVDQEHIELTDEELDAELATMGERLEMSADQVREQLEQGGRLSAVRSDRRKAKALRWLLDNVELVDEEGNPVSRDDLKVNQAEEDAE